MERYSPMKFSDLPEEDVFNVLNILGEQQGEGIIQYSPVSKQFQRLTETIREQKLKDVGLRNSRLPCPINPFCSPYPKSTIIPVYMDLNRVIEKGNIDHSLWYASEVKQQNLILWNCDCLTMVFELVLFDSKILAYTNFTSQSGFFTYPDVLHLIARFYTSPIGVTVGRDQREELADTVEKRIQGILNKDQTVGMYLKDLNLPEQIRSGKILPYNIFKLTTIGADSYSYKVNDIEVFPPSDVDKYNIKSGYMYVTTRTQYINSL